MIIRDASGLNNGLSTSAECNENALTLCNHSLPKALLKLLPDTLLNRTYSQNIIIQALNKHLKNYLYYTNMLILLVWGDIIDKEIRKGVTNLNNITTDKIFEKDF